MDDDANIIDVRFCKSAIHSVASLTYDDVRPVQYSPVQCSQGYFCVVTVTIIVTVTNTVIVTLL